jgi:tetratricopeptide (TPR) repeat protein
MNQSASTNQRRTPAAPPKSNKLAIALFLAAVVLLGAGAAWFHYIGSEQPWYARWQVNSYLKKQTGKGSFTVEFKFPSDREMAAGNTNQVPADVVATNLLTKKEYKILRKDADDLQREITHLRRSLTELYQDLAAKRKQLAAQERQLTSVGTNATDPAVLTLQTNVTVLKASISALTNQIPQSIQSIAAKTNQLGPIMLDLGVYSRTWTAQQAAVQSAATNEVVVAHDTLAKTIKSKLDTATTYRSMYELIGQQLYVSRRLSGSANPVHRRVALTAARQACNNALGATENFWLAARICEGYIWPNLDVADDPNWRGTLSVENLLMETANVFRQAEEMDKVISNYELLLTKATNPNRTDWARYQLAVTHDQAGNYSEALGYLKDIKNTNNYTKALNRMVPYLEQRIKAQQK